MLVLTNYLCQHHNYRHKNSDLILIAEGDEQSPMASMMSLETYKHLVKTVSRTPAEG